MANEIEFFFSPASRYSYLAATQMAGLERETGAALYGVAFHEPREFHFDYELLVQGAAAGLQLGAGGEFSLAIAAAVFASDRWPLDAALLTELAVAHGLDPVEFAAELTSERVAETVAQSAREAFERGAFGVPTFFVDSQMFWGNDRPVLVRNAALKQGAKS